jgi:hypothetical protein
LTTTDETTSEAKNGWWTLETETEVSDESNMKKKCLISMKALAALTVLATATTVVRADFNYPVGWAGWTYTYTGDAAAYGAGTPGSWDALDGTWNHTAGPGAADGAAQDRWDGSGIGGTLGPLNAPGGVQVGTQAGVNYLRMQDPGLTTGTTWANAQNSAFLFGKNINSMVSDPFNILDAVTLRFRIRVPTGTGLDNRYNGDTDLGAYPTDIGDGYANVSQGLGGIGIKASGYGLPSARGQGAISFSLGTSSDIGMPTNSGPALYMNNLYQDSPYNNVDWNEQGTRTSPPYVNNRLEIEDATQWNDFWVVITENDTTPFGVQGTHHIKIWKNGDSATAYEFNVTAGNANEDFGNFAAIMMGLPRDTDQTGYLTSGAMDVDFFSFVQGVWAPIPEPAAVALLGLGLLALAAHFRFNRRN